MVIHIDKEICKGCGLCIHYCPAMFSLTRARRSTRKGFAVAEAVYPEKCINCKMCEINCPDLAIFVDDSDSSKKAKAE